MFVVIVTVSKVLEEIQVLRNQAIKHFNDFDYDEAETKFQDVLAALLMMHPSDHPEVVKTEQSILLVQRRKLQQMERKM